MLLVLWVVIAGNTQGLSTRSLLDLVDMPLSKTDKFIEQRNFYKAGFDYAGDTVLASYRFRPKKRDKDDTIVRAVQIRKLKTDYSVIYQTGSLSEFQEIRRDLKGDGFVHGRPLDSLPELRQVFQRKNVLIESWLQPGEDSLYTLRLKSRELPELKDILYGEDLLLFNSHEELLTVFGGKYVKKDIYYFSEHEFSRCSVLFGNTDRQAVFIWKDETNNYGLSYLVLGGQLMLEKTVDFNLHVAENSWTLKSKVHAGMNLRELRKLNGIDFSFYNVRTRYSGMVLPDKSGNIDFKREGVVLACINCSDIEAGDKSMISADEALAEGRNIFVFTIMLYPPPVTSR